VLEGSGHTAESVRAAGGWVKLPTPMMEYKKWEKGSLRPDGQPGFDTPTGKFELWSSVLEDYGYEPLPKYTEPLEGPLARPDLAKDFPLVFNSGARPHTDFRSQHHGIRGLVRDNPEPRVELNTQDAEARGIRDGDLIEVRTPRGGVRFRARVTDDIAPGAIECNMGGGTPVGPVAWQESNVNELTDLANADEISGFPVYKALLCDVVRVAAGDGTAPPPPRGADACGPVTISAPVRRRRRIYLDNNATTQVSDAVRDAMLPYLGNALGNPSSIHGAGREAREAVETARRQVARLLSAKPRRIVFTGGGSEADNLALKGVAFRHEPGAHLVTTAIEHPAILQTCRFLERLGYRVTYLPVDEHGRVLSETLEAAITPETVLVSIMMANNEVGTIQPIADLARVARDAGVLFHTDAVQAAGKVPIDTEALGVDLLSLSAHKFHGPKGIGVLYVRKGVALDPVVHGGSQEAGLRAGTENVPAIVGMGRAADEARLAATDTQHLSALRDQLQNGVEALIPDARLNGHPTERLPNTLNLTLPALRGESLVVALDQHGISLSSGSACKSGSPDPTHVLLAMGRAVEEGHCAVRFSLSRETTGQDIEDTVEALAQVLEEMETTVRFLPCK
jgi:cysteine desulfurase NifS